MAEPTRAYLLSTCGIVIAVLGALVVAGLRFGAGTILLMPFGVPLVIIGGLAVVGIVLAGMPFLFDWKPVES